MFRIRRIYDDSLPLDRNAIEKVQKILRDQFPTLSEKSIGKLPEQLRNPLKYRFRSILFVAESYAGDVKGFAILQHDPDLRFCYLDYISAAKYRMNAGTGSALYARVRDGARGLKVLGIFFECLPDDPKLCKDPLLLKQNRSRLRFYELHGARPIINTAYATPFKAEAEADCPPYLMYDNLGSTGSLGRGSIRPIVRAILERKYGHRTPPGYIDTVVQSFKDNPVQIREPVYTHRSAPPKVRPIRAMEKRIALIVNDQHEIHHVHDRGYVESPVRVKAILREIATIDLFERVSVRHFSEGPIRAVHDGDFVTFLKKVCAGLEPGVSLYPYVFPIRNNARPPKDLPIRAGYYCIDTFTPINQNAYLAARRAVDCALTAAGKIVEGYRFAYALVRPPGHHAERRAFGGFCYFNSTAIAAHQLSSLGRVAVLDLDYHHGNGTQNIFYHRSDVVTFSIHGHPRIAYPYFSGFEDERGEGEGMGFNINVPLPEQVTAQQYKEVLARQVERIMRLKVKFLVVCLGLDTAKGDPTGSWSLMPRDFRECGRLVGSTHLPTLIVQEGGYRIRSLGSNARNFFLGLIDAPGSI